MKNTSVLYLSQKIPHTGCTSFMKDTSIVYSCDQFRNLCIYLWSIFWLPSQVKINSYYVFSSALLQRVLNPPDPDAIEEALESLVQIHALEKTTSGRYEPTFYGCLLNSLPLSFDSSVLALKFCELGAIHEGILISIMLDIQPLPILHTFGYRELVCGMLQLGYGPSFISNSKCCGSYSLLSVLQCQKYIDNYFKGNGSVQIGKKEATTIGNLCAFQFWERVFKVYPMCNNPCAYIGHLIVLFCNIDKLKS